MATKITDPSYISEHMLDKVVKEKFQDNADDAAVWDQAIKFLHMFRSGATHDQIEHIGKEGGGNAEHNRASRQLLQDRAVLRSGYSESPA
jgi:hypothetical protein